MKGWYIGVFSALVLPLTLRGMNWPSEEARMTINFGANDQGNPVMGTSWTGQGVVRAAETGELLFNRNVNNAGRLPSPLGAWTALDHGDGLISIYGRLEENKNISLPVTVEKGMVIGDMGISGWSNRSGFYFLLFDRKERRYVNPAMIIQPIPDAKPPVIQAVVLKNSAGAAIDLMQGDRNSSAVRTINRGTYTVFVTVFDGADVGENTLAPHKLICSLNGLEVGAVTFETFFSRNGVLMVYRNGPAPVRTVYAETSYFEMGLASFTYGQASLEIIAQDINENFQSAVFKFNVE
jgi:hypothetical protein